MLILDFDLMSRVTEARLRAVNNCLQRRSTNETLGPEKDAGMIVNLRDGVLRQMKLRPFRKGVAIRTLDGPKPLPRDLMITWISRFLYLRSENSRKLNCPNDFLVMIGTDVSSFLDITLKSNLLQLKLIYNRKLLGKINKDVLEIIALYVCVYPFHIPYNEDELPIYKSA